MNGFSLFGFVTVTPELLLILGVLSLLAAAIINLGLVVRSGRSIRQPDPLIFQRVFNMAAFIFVAVMIVAVLVAGALWIFLHIWQYGLRLM